MHVAYVKTVDIVVKVIKCRIRRLIFLKICLNGERAQACKCKNDNVF